MKADQSQFVKVIELKDRSGRVTGTKEVITYQGLLSKAHDEGLKAIRTSLLQIPSEDNSRTAIVKAEVETEKGRFEALGDASPESVTSFLTPHLIRMAETRAKARALRDAVNVGVVSFEELDGEDLPGRDPSDLGSGAVQPNGRASRSTRSAPQSKAVTSRNGEETGDGAFVSMTENQRKYIFRLLSTEGFQGEAAEEKLKDLLLVGSLTEISKTEAGALIDRLVASPRGAPLGGPQLLR
jgi:hypothetical protein